MGIFGRKNRALEAVVIEKRGDVGIAPYEIRDGSADAAVSDEIAAVIAAAVAAYGAEQYRGALAIRKIDREAGERPAWGVMGMQEAIDVRRI